MPADSYVTPGLVDIHTHFDSAAGGRNLQPDHNCLPHGVTTAVIAPVSRGMSEAKTRLLAFVDPDRAVELTAKYPDLVVGILANSRNIERAVRQAEESSRTIVMLEPDSGDGEQIVRRLRPGDIQTHMYSRLTPLAPWMREARTRGILFDVGHGAQGFWFRVAVPALGQGFLPDTISSGMDAESVLLPRADMMTTLSKLLNLGMTLEQLVSATANPGGHPAAGVGHTERGRGCGYCRDGIGGGQVDFLDSCGDGRLPGDRRLRCVPSRFATARTSGIATTQRAGLDQSRTVHEFQVRQGGLSPEGRV